MSGIYGDFLLAFPEQFTTITVYAMTPKVNGGWSKVEQSDQLVKGIFQNTGGKQLRNSNGNLVESSGAEFWSETAGLSGKFATVNNIVYRLNSDNDWTNEGGFCRYGLEKVIGNNGSESTDTTWNTGADTFS